MLRNIVLGITILAVFLLGLWISKFYYTTGELKSQEQSEVLLEKIKTVAKLVTVEGYFSEVYDYKDYWGYDISLFRKKALLRVRAKVSAGYDLNQMKLEARPEEKVLIISNLPDPEILSIDHNIDYYDITEGAFNSFTATDYTRLNQNAKAFIEQKARESDLLLSAEKQGNQALELIQFMVENAGWTLRYQPRTAASPLDAFTN